MMRIIQLIIFIITLIKKKHTVLLSTTMAFPTITGEQKRAHCSVERSMENGGTTQKYF